MFPLSRLLVVATVLGGLLGCGVSEDNFIDKAARATCGYTERCYRGTFVDNWDDMADCIDDYIDDNEDFYDDLNDECDFEPDEADKCLDSYREATRTCDDDDIEYDDCLDIWDC